METKFYSIEALNYYPGNRWNHVNNMQTNEATYRRTVQLIHLGYEVRVGMHIIIDNKESVSYTYHVPVIEYCQDIHCPNFKECCKTLCV